MRTGLRTEIVVSISLLLGAALLFAGFLLVKLTEQELLEQRLQQARTTAGLVRQMLMTTGGRESPFAGAVPLTADLLGWRLLDARLQPLASVSLQKPPAFPDLPLLPGAGQIHEQYHYSSSWLPWQSGADNILDLTLLLDADAPDSGIVQLRFSLDGLVERVHRAQRLVLVYVVAYGLVLALFGIFLLNRNLVRPIRRLQQATTAIAGGSLAPVITGDGPTEIVELSSSFNLMVTALAESRKETQAQIASLEQANRELQQARDDLLRSARMASVGHLAAGMAHEIGNPLAALIGYLDVLGRGLAGSTDRDLVERAQAETGRIDRLIRDLLDYAAPGGGVAEPFCPIALLRETVAMLAHQGQFDGLTVDDRCGDASARVCMDRQRLQQVWVNLLLNARDATGPTGRIRLTAHCDGELRLAIADEGPGVPAELREKIFEPFFTTKAPGKGRGLGLAVCQRIIDDAGGRIEVAADGSGATFTVCLPVATAAPLPASPRWGEE
ncbi:MAG: HAMP domain-containing sensor histidine kinase [Desulfuromonadales bacterium]|nr:HAMP domain-containing sensor histidine kinase [Desulfuromonadales bacterium]